MTHLIFLIGLLLVSTTTDDGWMELFNGNDLDGWEANVEPESFSVVRGVIRARCTSPTVRSHLFYGGNNSGPSFQGFRNFELKVIVKGEPDSNSGIFFHTDSSTRDQKLHLRKGYEVQLNSAAKEKRKTGSLYAIEDVLEAPVDDTNWFEVHLTVIDKRIVVRLDGKEVIDYTEPDDPERQPNRSGRLLDPNGGAIALQAHDPNSIWYFKSIRIKNLPD